MGKKSKVHKTAEHSISRLHIDLIPISVTSCRDTDQTSQAPEVIGERIIGLAPAPTRDNDNRRHLAHYESALERGVSQLFPTE